MRSSWDEEADEAFGYLLFVFVRFVLRTLRRMVTTHQATTQEQPGSGTCPENRSR